MCASSEFLWIVINKNISKKKTSGEPVDYHLNWYKVSPVGLGLLYTQYDQVSGTELWRTSGAPGSEQLVLDIWPDQGADQSSYINHTTVYDDIMYFFADDGIHGDEPWRSDGTESGTYMAKDIALGPRSSLPLGQGPQCASLGEQAQIR